MEYSEKLNQSARRSRSPPDVGRTGGEGGARKVAMVRAKTLGTERGIFAFGLTRKLYSALSFSLSLSSARRRGRAGKLKKWDAFLIRAKLHCKLNSTTNLRYALHFHYLSYFISIINRRRFPPTAQNFIYKTGKLEGTIGLKNIQKSEMLCPWFSH